MKSKPFRQAVDSNVLVFWISFNESKYKKTMIRKMQDLASITGWKSALIQWQSLEINYSLRLFLFRSLKSISAFVGAIRVLESEEPMNLSRALGRRALLVAKGYLIPNRARRIVRQREATLT